MKPIYNLSNWTIESFPEGYWLIGFQYSNLFPDAPTQKRLIHTSKLLNIEFGDKETRAETKNSIYILDPIDKLYTATYLKNVTDIATGGTIEPNIVDDSPDPDDKEEDDEH